MVTLQKVGNYSNRDILKIDGLSKDEKPIDSIEGVTITNGSKFLEIDTGEVYCYDQSTKCWIKQQSNNTGVSLNYKDIIDKPKINNHELVTGNNTLDDLGIQKKGDYSTLHDLDAKLDKNQGTINSGKLLGIDGNGNIIPVNKQETIGKTGMTGQDGREIDIRKSEVAIEWKYSKNIKTRVQFNSAGICVPVISENTVDYVELVGCPQNAKFINVNVVTLYGTDDSGNNIANVDCSTSVNINFDFLGGFNPKKQPIEITPFAIINGNMDIKTVQKEGMQLFSGSSVTRINKIRLLISLLDKDKKNIGENICVDFIINLQKETEEWKEIISLKEIQELSDVISDDDILNLFK